MKNLILILMIFSLISCKDKVRRLEWSNSFAVIIITKEDIESQIEKRKRFEIVNKKQDKIFSKTNEILTYFDEYEKNLFHILELEKTDTYDFDWFLKLESINDYKILTEKIIGEPCDLIKGQYTLSDLYNNITTYNSTLDSISNTTYCKENISFNSIINPKKDHCIDEDDRFYNMSLNNHIIGILRLKEAILKQEEMIFEKTKSIPLSISSVRLEYLRII